MTLQEHNDCIGLYDLYVGSFYITTMIYRVVCMVCCVTLQYHNDIKDCMYGMLDNPVIPRSIGLCEWFVTAKSYPILSFLHSEMLMSGQSKVFC